MTSIIAAIGCAFLFIFAFIILMVLLGLLRQFFVRAAALENAGIGESFRRGWGMFKRNWKSAGLMWLVMLGIGIGVGIVGLIVFFLLIPAYIVLILPAAIVAAHPRPGCSSGSPASSPAARWPGSWVFWLPCRSSSWLCLHRSAYVSGWYLIYQSSVWTLTYREIKALESVVPVALPAAPEKTA